MILTFFQEDTLGIFYTFGNSNPYNPSSKVGLCPFIIYGQYFPCYTTPNPCHWRNIPEAGWFARHIFRSKALNPLSDGWVFVYFRS